MGVVWLAVMVGCVVTGSGIVGGCWVWFATVVWMVFVDGNGTVGGYWELYGW